MSKWLLVLFIHLQFFLKQPDSFPSPQKSLKVTSYFFSQNEEVPGQNEEVPQSQTFVILDGRSFIFNTFSRTIALLLQLVLI